MSFQNLKTPGAVLPQIPEAAFPKSASSFRPFATAAALTIGSLLPGGILARADAPVPGAPGPVPAPGPATPGAPPAPAMEKGKYSDYIDKSTEKATAALGLLASGKATPEQLKDTRELVRALSFQIKIIDDKREKTPGDFVLADGDRYAKLVTATEDLQKLLKPRASGPAVPAGVPSAAPAPGRPVAPPAAAPAVSQYTQSQLLAMYKQKEQQTDVVKAATGEGNTLPGEGQYETVNGHRVDQRTKVRPGVVYAMNDLLDKAISQGMDFSTAIKLIVQVPTQFSQAEIVRFCEHFIESVNRQLPPDQAAARLNVDPESIHSDASFLRKEFNENGRLADGRKKDPVEPMDRPLTQAEFNKFHDIYQKSGNREKLLALQERRNQQAGDEASAMHAKEEARLAAEVKRAADMEKALADAGEKENERVKTMEAANSFRAAMEARRVSAENAAQALRGAQADWEAAAMHAAQNGLAGVEFLRKFANESRNPELQSFVNDLIHSGVTQQIPAFGLSGVKNGWTSGATAIALLDLFFARKN